MNQQPAPEIGNLESEHIGDKVQCSSSKGTFTILVHRQWAPNGAKRFLELVRNKAYDGTVIYRNVRSKKSGEPEACQFGFLKNQTLRHKYSKEEEPLQDDPQLFSDPNFRRGMISFAGSGPNSRRTDLFITFMTGNANGRKTAPWEVPFGIISENDLITVIGKFGGAGDLAQFGGNAPDLSKGYEVLKTSHPDIDYLGKCMIVEKSIDIASVKDSTVATAAEADAMMKCLESSRCAGTLLFFALGLGFIAFRPVVRTMTKILLHSRGKKQ